VSPESKFKQSQMDLFCERMQQNKSKPGPLMATLYDAQSIFGCIPLSIQKMIAEELDEPIAKVNGVVTFYSHFSVEPKGKHIVGVCMGTACLVKGAQPIMDAVSKELGITPGQTTEDKLFTLDVSRCIGACTIAPVFTVGSVVYGKATPQSAIDTIRLLKNSR
jgi:formate dehydrogenase (NAD+, ferredoxin) subunit C